LKKYFKIGILFTLVFWAQSLRAQDNIPLNTFHSFEASSQSGYTYSWWYVDVDNITTYFSSNSNITEEYYWDTLGEFELFVQAQDENGCVSEVITKSFEIIQINDYGNFAGNDTVIGSCEPLVLGGKIIDEENFDYLWEPVENLDDPTSPTPTFTPGNTTLFTITITDNDGISTTDEVEIDVVELIAEAGFDVFMDNNATAVLDGSTSIGAQLQYHWTTTSGTIDSGENTEYPVVSGFGKYYLEVTDLFGCVSLDSVFVENISFAPFSIGDDDTTSYQTEVKISVLDNDTDLDNDIDSLSLAISEIPYNGTAYIDFTDFTIHYTPNDGFSGEDEFMYRLCDASNNCTDATVRVFVTEYEFLIPDAFSPNGDGINDYFEIIGIDRFAENKIAIFNRWGNKVYETNRYGISSTPTFWDGKSNTGFLMGDKDLPSGTYYYVLKLGSGQKPVAGSIYLDR
jgi:gliding motility-associated-like protein